jgi:hypothetical protein
MRILLDECVPRKLGRRLRGQEWSTVPKEGSLHWLALSCLSVLLLPKPVSDIGAATPLTVIQEIRMIGMVPQLTIAGQVGQTNRSSSGE